MSSEVNTVGNESSEARSRKDRRRERRAEARRRVFTLGAPILCAESVKSQRRFVQHGKWSVYAHTVQVAIKSVRIAEALGVRCDEKALVRGALLHDYFLYDWHEDDPSHNWHGYIHAARALENAERDFELNDIERDIIRHHMFPLNLFHPPRRREAVIVCLADKIVALRETVKRR